MDETKHGILHQLGPVSLVSVLLGVMSQSFCCNIGHSSETIVEADGKLVQLEAHGINYGALFLGPLGMTVGIVAMVLAVRGPRELRTGRLIVAAIGVVLAMAGTWFSTW